MWKLYFKDRRLPNDLNREKKKLGVPSELGSLMKSYVNEIKLNEKSLMKNC